MKGNRLGRVNQLVLSALTEIIPREIRDEQVQASQTLSITGVKVSPDLHFAKVYLCSADEKSEQLNLVAALNHARGFVRKKLAERIRLRFIPELHFELDGSMEEGRKIEAILVEIAAEDATRRVSADEDLLHIAKVITAVQTILITSHPNPDGDAIGSMLGAYWGLTQLGKIVTLYNPSDTPKRLSFLAGTNRIVHTMPERTFDATLVLDCSEPRMFPEEKAPLTQMGTVLVLDHHKTRGALGDVCYFDPDAASVGVIVYRLFEKLGVQIDENIANALYCSILSDTGSFRYQNSNPEALRIAASLVACGVDPWHIASHLYETVPVSQLRLLTKVLDTLVVSSDGRAASLTVTEAMLQETGCTADMVDGFVNYARGIEGVEVALLLRPREDDVRVSLRSRGNIDVSDIAVAFGGGGHKNAAGFQTTLELSQARERIFRQVSAIYNERVVSSREKKTVSF